jgi:hypothetical protein
MEDDPAAPNQSAANRAYRPAPASPVPLFGLVKLVPLTAMESAGTACHIPGMAFTVDIVHVEPPGPDSEQGMPSFRLPGGYRTLEEARDAAEKHLDQLGRPIGAAYYRISAGNGQEV